MADTSFTALTDLAMDRLGGVVLDASDDFFAEKENLIRQEEPVFKPGLYTDNGKWMDGWESRRKRTPGHDWCVIQLAVPGVINGVDVDTSHFVGNHPPEISIDAFNARDGRTVPPGDSESDWLEIVPKTVIQENGHNLIPCKSSRAWSHVRLNIYPDGGVARLRVYGDVVPEWPKAAATCELSGIRLGARVVGCSDDHFSRMDNLLLPDPPRNMGDGWETRRSRRGGNDWVIIQLGRPGFLSRIELDTTFYKGNYPDSCSVDGALLTGGHPLDARWLPVLTEHKLEADRAHVFDLLVNAGPFSHVRLNIFPDGGVARLRVLGTIDFSQSG